MRKLNFLILIFTALLVSGNAWGKTYTVGTSGADYVDFDKARNAASAGDEIKFVTDQTWTTADEGTNKGYLSKDNLTINLNGKTITRTCGSNLFSTNGSQNVIFTGTEGSRLVYTQTSTYALRFYYGGSFTFQGNIRIDAPKPFGVLNDYSAGNGTVTIASGATLTINNDIVSPKITFVNNGTLIIDGGTFEGTNGNKAFTGNYLVKSGLFKQSVYDNYVDGHMPAGTLTGVEGEYVRVAQPIANPVAQIGVAQYATLSAAVSAAKSGDEIQLLKDVTENVSISKSNLTFSGDKTIYGSVSTSLSDCQITLAGVSINSNTDGLTFGNKSASIILKENTVNNITASAAGSDGIVKFYGTGSNFTISGDGVLNIYGAQSGIHTYACTLVISAPNIRVMGSLSVYLDLPAPSVITAGTYSDVVPVPAGYVCEDNGDGTYTVKSANVYANGKTYGSVEEAVEAVSIGDEIKLLNNIASCSINKSIILNLNDFNISGTITADNADVTLYTHAWDLNDEAASTIGGISEENNGHIYYREGSYNLDPTGKLAPNMYSKSYSGYYVVAPHVAQIGSNYFLSLREAFSSIENNATVTITLLADAVLDSYSYILIRDNKTITLDFNGHSVTMGEKVFYVYETGSVTLTGQGHYYSDDVGFKVRGALAPNTTKTVLNIGKQITMHVKGYGINVMYNGDGDHGRAYGVKVLIEGDLSDTKKAVYIHGNVNNVAGTDTIADDCAEIVFAPTSKTNGIYAAGYGRFTINGGEHTDVYEMRAGEMVVNDGNFTNTNVSAVSFQKNESGATVSGSCNIGIAQHCTKQTTVVTINGGTFSAVTPIAQANPQENDPELSKLVKCYIKGGLFTSTSADADDILRSQEDNRIFASAGFYNEKPADKCIAMGYSAIELETELPKYQAEYDLGYRWRIGLTGVTDTVYSKPKTDDQKHDWSTEAKDVWSDGKEPTAGTDVTINGNDIVVTTVAQAYGVTIVNADTASLTIETTGTLLVGNGGITNVDKTKFTIEGDGVLAIAPENANQPLATIQYVAKYAGKKDGITEVTDVDQVYWEQMAIPTASAPASFTEPDDCGGKHYYNVWDITEGWQSVNKSQVKTPFTGYFMTNFSDYSATDKDNTYTFTGTTFGNKVSVLNFIREGYTFFGNSYTAPMSIPELLQELNTNDIQATVYVYRPLKGTYYTVNMATVGRGGRPTEINKMQGFFVYAKKKTSTSASYQDVVWDPLLAKLSMTTASSPARKAARQMQSEINTAATIIMTSANGWTDDLVLLEGANMTDDFDQNYDAQKMMGEHINMYVPADQNMAVYAVEDLSATPITVKTNDQVAYTFTFSEIEGENLYLYDEVTKVTTPIAEGNSYQFVANANTTVSNRFSIRKTPGMATDMQIIRGADMQQGIYTIMGQYIGDATLWNTLPNGVYVVNGQKVVK